MARQMVLLGLTFALGALAGMVLNGATRFGVWGALCGLSVALWGWWRLPRE